MLNTYVEYLTTDDMKYLMAIGMLIGFLVAAASLHLFMEMISRAPKAQVEARPEEVAPAEEAVEQTPRSQLKIAA